jgi:hypothetical protein
MPRTKSHLYLTQPRLATPLSTFEVLIFPTDLARPGLYIDIAGDRSFKILDTLLQSENPSLLLVKDLSWMKDSGVCRLARENGGMKSCFVSKDGVSGGFSRDWRSSG